MATLITIGDIKQRLKIIDYIKNFNTVKICSEKAQISPNTLIGKGAVVMPGSVINYGAIIG